MRTRLVTFVSLSLLAHPVRLYAQMIDPAIDRDGEPFCYFSRPTDVIGVMDGRQGTLISPEGYLYTGFGELMFFTGDPPVPVEQRVKTLSKGYLPVVEYQIERDRVRYHFTMFAATLDGRPESPLINFIRVRIQNRADQPRMAFFAIAHRYQNPVNTEWGTGDNRFSRPWRAKTPGQYEQAGVEFSKDWIYGFSDDGVLRGGKVMTLFPVRPALRRMLALKSDYLDAASVGPRKMRVLPTTPVGVVQYPLALKPNEEMSLDFKMPYDPIPKDSSMVDELRRAGFDQYMQQTADFWDKIIHRGIEITVSEEKVNNTFKASLVYDLIARNKVDSFYIQKVNDFQYHAFWLRDASYIVRMYDLTGYHDIARECLGFFARWQQPDGNFVSQGGQFDGWGQTMWAYGQHFRMTGDKGFAAQVYPSVRRAVEWLRKARMEDPLHVIPITTPGDNEDISGHITGHNFAALGGLRNAIVLADSLGRKDDAESWRHQYDDYRSTLLTILRRIAGKTGGYIPPGLDTLGGQDWGNMESIYPETILDPSDPMVSTTIKATRAKYQEGIMTYGDGRWLHHYLTMSNTESEVIRGDQETAITEFYAILVHTSATHAGFEYDIPPWSTRDFGMNLSPHGWFAAKFRALLRNMMVREEGHDLHLLSCVSPAWIKDGATISVRRAPTEFGEVSFDLICRKGHATLKLTHGYRRAPHSVILHLPWFMQVSGVTAEGRNLQQTGSAVALPDDARNIEIDWVRDDRVANLNYDASVQQYKKEYRRRYERFLQSGDGERNK